MNHVFEEHSEDIEDPIERERLPAFLGRCSVCPRWINRGSKSECAGLASMLPPERERRMWNYVERLKNTHQPWDERFDPFLEF